MKARGGCGCSVVSAWREMGEWKFDICRDPKELNTILAQGVV